MARKQGQNLSTTTKPFLPHHSLSTLSVGVSAQLLTVRTHYHHLGAAAAADVATGPSDVRACTPHASLGQPRHDALHRAVMAQEHLLLTLPKLNLLFLLHCVEVPIERDPFVPHLVGEEDGTDLRSGTVWHRQGFFDTSQAKVTVAV